jgi:hypothetical protein
VPGGATRVALRDQLHTLDTTNWAKPRASFGEWHNIHSPRWPRCGEAQIAPGPARKQRCSHPDVVINNCTWDIARHDNLDHLGSILSTYISTWIHTRLVCVGHARIFRLLNNHELSKEPSQPLRANTLRYLPT